MYYVHVLSNEACDGECLDSDEKEEFEARATWVIQAEGDVEHELIICNSSPCRMCAW